MVAARAPALKAIRAARAAARERAWPLAGDAAPGAGRGLVTIDLDATIVIAHSEKEPASTDLEEGSGPVGLLRQHRHSSRLRADPRSGTGHQPQGRSFYSREIPAR
jgi:hypothetical protein